MTPTNIDLPIYPASLPSTLRPLPPFPKLTQAFLSPTSPHNLLCLQPHAQAHALNLCYLSLLAVPGPELPSSRNHLLQWLLNSGLPPPAEARTDRRLLYRSCTACLAAVLDRAAEDEVGEVGRQVDSTWVLGWVGWRDEVVGEAMAEVVGLLGQGWERGKCQTVCEELTEVVRLMLDKGDARVGRGACLTLGVMLEAREVEGVTGEVVRSLMRAIESVLDNIHGLGCKAVGRIARRGSLSIGESEMDKLMTGLIGDVKGARGRERRAEAAADCLSCLFRGSHDRRGRAQEVAELCIGIGGLRDEELQFAIGRIWAAVADQQNGEGVIDKVQESVGATNPHLRLSAGTWLLVLVKEGTGREEWALETRLDLQVGRQSLTAEQEAPAILGGLRLSHSMLSIP